MTNQEIFDIVCSEIIKQGLPCIDTKNRPKYYYRDKKCPIGFLIPENDYRISFEDKKVKLDPYDGVGDDDYIVQLYFYNRNMDLDFLKKIQDLHDSHALYPNFLIIFKRGMKEIGIEYKLDLHVLEILEKNT